MSEDEPACSVCGAPEHRYCECGDRHEVSATDPDPVKLARLITEQNWPVHDMTNVLARAVLRLAEECDDMRDKLRVSEEQNDALGDANVLSVENERLTASLDAARAERDAAVREADRWRHGVAIEGDYVCPADLERDALKSQLAECRAVLAQCEKTRNGYHDLIGSLGGLVNDRWADIFALREALKEACDAWADREISIYGPNRERIAQIRKLAEGT